MGAREHGDIIARHGGRPVAKLLATVAIALASLVVDTGCDVSRGGLASGTASTCEAFVCNDEGHIEKVSSMDPEFAGLEVFNFCVLDLSVDLATEEMWRRILEDVLNAGPTFRDHAGPWHLRAANCEVTTVFTTEPACPATGTTAIDDCMADDASCVIAAPQPLDFAATNLSQVSEIGTIAYENTCTEPQLVRADLTVFDDPFDQFSVVSNGCELTTVDGRELAPFGDEGDGCTVDFRFEPKDVGVQTASYRVPVVGATLLDSTLRGEGVGTTPRNAGGVARYCIDPGPADCASVMVGATGEEPAGFRVTAIDYEVLTGTGFTEPPTGPAIDSVFAPGASALYEAEWCRSASTLPSERLQLLLTTTTAAPSETREFRFTIDAPASCP